MREKLIIRIEKFEGLKNMSIDSLLLNGEEIELYLSGSEGLFWITNKRIMVAYKAIDDDYHMTANRYETFQYSTIFSLAVDIIDEGLYNVLNIDFKEEFKIQLFVNDDIPIADIALVLTDKILNRKD